MKISKISINQKGFTLLELLWVIIIIGFLAAMLAPRLGGVSSMAEKNVDNANILDVKKYVKQFQNDHPYHHDFPDHLINLVLANDDGKTDVVKPSVQIRTNDWTESISEEFDQRCILKLHVLNSDEAAELKDLGVEVVRSWNHPDDLYYDDTPPPGPPPGTYAYRYDEVSVDQDVGVLMVGGCATGSGSADKIIAADNGGPDNKGFNDEMGSDRIGNPEWLYRIVLPVGPRCELITEGYIENAPRCPRGSNNKNYFLGYYSIILPRLQASVDRLDGTFSNGVKVQDYSNEDGGEEKTVHLEKMEYWDFDVCNARGHGFLDDDYVQWWKITEIPAP